MFKTATSPLRSSLMPPNFPPILPHPQNLMNSIAESSFGLGKSGLLPKLPTSLSGPLPGHPPGGGGGGPPPPHPPKQVTTPTRSPPRHNSRTPPSNEFTSQQNWSFEEQFKQVGHRLESESDAELLRPPHFRFVDLK